MRRVHVSFAWYDIWVGAYIDRENGALYVCPLPCVVIRWQYADRPMGWWSEGERQALVELVREAQQRPHGPSYPAGPTTDAATVATRVYDSGRVRVRGHAQ